jgi:hypothetical protein
MCERRRSRLGSRAFNIFSVFVAIGGRRPGNPFGLSGVEDQANPMT